MRHARCTATYLLLVGILASVAWSQSPLHNTMPKVPTVFVTETGEKYHLGTCRHLQKSRREISVEEALKQGYQPCGACKPPQQ